MLIPYDEMMQNVCTLVNLYMYYYDQGTITWELLFQINNDI